jgi:hypothetical protein
VRTPISTFRARALPSSTTWLMNPRSLACTARSGTTTADLCVSEASSTSAKNPGFNTPGFVTQARISTCRVAGSATSPTW